MATILGSAGFGHRAGKLGAGAVCALVGALVGALFGVVPVAAAPNPSGPDPKVRSASADGPLTVQVAASPQALLTLNVPEGRWVAWAKVGVGYVETHPGYQLVRCSLKGPGGGSQAQTGHAVVGAFGAADSEWYALSTSAAYGPNGGTFVLGCAADATGAHANRLRIIALKVGSLTTGPTTGAPATSGSGSPRAIHRWRTPELAVGASLTTVATVPLTDGRWFVRASFSAHAPDPSGNPDLDVECVLDVDGTTDTSETTMFAGVKMSQRMVALDAAGTVTEGPRGAVARLRCASTQPAFVGAISITALKAGSLTRVNLANGNATAAGSGPPRVRHGYRTDEVSLHGPSEVLLGSLTLGAGRWMILAKVLARGDEDLVGCVIRRGSTLDHAGDEEFPLGSTLPLAAVVTLSRQNTVDLSCQSAAGSAPSGPFAAFARLTAIKVAPRR